MVLKVVADGKVDDSVDALSSEVLLGSDTRELKELGRVNCSTSASQSLCEES